MTEPNIDPDAVARLDAVDEFKLNVAHRPGRAFHGWRTPRAVDMRLVLLICGHWFVETVPPGDQTDPNLPRVCGEHYPRQYRAVYLPVPPELMPVGMLAIPTAPGE